MVGGEGGVNGGRIKSGQYREEGRGLGIKSPSIFRGRRAGDSHCCMIETWIETPEDRNRSKRANRNVLKAKDAVRSTTMLGLS